MPRRHLTRASRDACVAEVASLFDHGRGLSVDDLAAVYGTKRATIRVWLTEAGVHTADGACIGLDDEELAQALATRWHAGTKVRAIMRETGLSERRVSQLLAAAGMDTSVLWERRMLPVDMVIADRETGMSIRALARKYQCSRTLIENVLEDQGVQRPEPARREPSEHEVIRGLRAAHRTELRGEAARRYAAGQPAITITELAADLGVANRLARALLAEAGIRSRRCLVGLTKEQTVRALAARHRFGIPVGRLARDTGLVKSRINTLIREAGLALPPGHRSVLKMTVSQLAAAYRRGGTLDELAASAGCSAQTVRRRLVKAGVTIRPMGTNPVGRWQAPTMQGTPAVADRTAGP